MFPSENLRKSSMQTIKPALIKNVFRITGICILVIGLILMIALRNIIIEGSSNGVPTGRYAPGWIIGVPIVGFGVVFTLIGFLFIPAVFNSMKKGEINYPVAEAKMPKEELFRNALMLNSIANSGLYAEVNGNWIDFSVNWKNCFSADIFTLNLNRSMTVYKKLIYVYNDYTYEELDCEAEAAIGAGVLTFIGESHVKCGRFKHRRLVYNFGKDYNSGKIGINEYSMDTVVITNQVHKWLADRGYRQR